MEMTGDVIAEQSGVRTVTVGTQTDGKGEDRMPNDGIGSFPGRLRVTVNTETNKRFLRFADQKDQLFPGIPDEITLHQIVPKMQWKVFHNLSLVSLAWREAIQNRQVHDARVCSHSTELFVATLSPSGKEIVLFSARYRYFYRLPKIPDRDLHAVTCAALDGKIYILGGWGPPKGKRYWKSRKVYVLDVAGQRKWKQCARMKARRSGPGCGVLDGKIYVFGGAKSETCRSQVYDPKENTWSRLSHEVGNSGFTRSVAALGEELFLYDGNLYADPYSDDDADNEEHFWQVYHPVKDEWRLVFPFAEKERTGIVFFAEGKLHLMNEVGIHVYQHDNNTWSYLQSISNAADLGLNDSGGNYLSDIVALNGELLAAVYTEVGNFLFFLRSEGFGSNAEEILWRRENVALPTRNFHFVCTLKL